jgi:hypothetical protein
MQAERAPAILHVRAVDAVFAVLIGWLHDRAEDAALLGPSA